MNELIRFDEVNKIFYINTKNTTYILNISKNKYLGHVYWGKSINKLNINNAYLERGLCFSATPDKDDRSYSLDYLKQEYPVGLGTDYRIPAISMLFEDGSRVLELEYHSFKILDKKPELDNLPMIYTQDGDKIATLIITLKDRVKNVLVEVSYTSHYDFDAITRNVKIINASREKVVIEKVMSASVDFEESNYDFIELPGAWGRERHIERTALRSGNQSIDSKRGASSHQHNPFIAIADKNANEEYGNVYAMNFVYSGNFVAGVEVDQIKSSRMYMGINDYDFSWKLDENDVFQAPEVVMVYSNNGLGKMSRIFHKLYRERLVRGKFKDSIRPILINNWEATYFDFNEEKIVSLAKEANELGIELLVLDDGWFGKRNDDTTSLGDWYVNKNKLPNGIESLAKKVNEQGIQFGLWFEPEMISLESELFKKHPEWSIQTKERESSLCRHQFILDLSRREVQDFIIEAVSSMLEKANISYVKWDMNRHMTQIGSLDLSKDRQKELPHRYMLGLYRVLEEITSKHEDVLFESCSGGGGRFDPGMLYYMPQVWTSDDTDAVERLYIQYGTSLVYPISTMGSHVSAVPNHQSHRVTNLNMRGDVAMSGNFGYELDLTKFTEEEKEIVKKQVSEYKELRKFLFKSDMYRVASPFETNNTAWIFVSEDKNDVFAAYFRKNAIVNPPIERFKFTGIDENSEYSIVGTDEIYTGCELMNIGLVIDMWGDSQSRTFRLKRKTNN